MLFSQRKGYKPVSEMIQLERMDSALRNGLWNAVTETYWALVDSPYIQQNEHIYRLVKGIWGDVFKGQVDTIEPQWKNVHREIRDYFFRCKWYEVFDFVEYLVIAFPFEGINKVFISYCNGVLERERSAYRFVSGRIMDITSEGEINEIEEALQNSSSSNTVNSHLKRGLELLVDRNAPDYRNSIKESISAIEAMCKIVSGQSNATLGSALTRIEKDGNVQLHGALKEAFSRLYGYTSDADGIRHALMSESSLSFEDAKFMLITCSAFVNYLKVKASNAGVKL